jgi:two-component system response regulator VicR
MTANLDVKKVLIADDDPDIRRLARAMLTRHGCEVVEAGDGDEIVAVALQQRPELMVVDVVLPTGTGYEAVSALAKRGFTCPVLFYSAVAKDDVLYRAHKPPSPSAFMLKPFTEGELIAQIEALLDQML